MKKKEKALSALGVATVAVTPEMNKMIQQAVQFSDS